jgi:CO/xanthine dehydrogenase Mo-binding subunit
MKRALQHVGNPDAQQVDGLEKVLGTARYVGDLRLPGMLYACLLSSPLPHARIARLDVAPALAIPGVTAAITSADFIEHGYFGWPVKDAFILAYQKVRYVGDPIAVVAAESEEIAEAGVAAILLELEPLPVVSDPGLALVEGAPLVPLQAPLGEGNLCARHIVRNGQPEPLLAECAHLLEQTYQFAHQEHACIETEGVLAIPEPGGGVTIFANNQSPHINQENAAAVLGLPPEAVRIIQPPVGGSFGGKDDHVYQFTAQAARLALITGRPVRLVLDRAQSFLVSYKREAASIRLRIGMDAHGALRAAEGHLLCDSGAYASMTPLSTWRACMHLVGAYRYAAAVVEGQAAYTNNGYSGAFRGFGNTHAAAASELAIDELAGMIAMDPLEFRLKNCLRTGDRAFTGNRLEHTVGLEACLRWVQERSGWIAKRAEYTASNRTSAVACGLGVACYFHGSGLGGEGLDYARSTIKIERDHSITLQSGLTDYGQGSRTVFTLIAAEALGVSPSRIHMLRPDTQTAPETGPTVASRASIVGGNVTRSAAEKLNHLLRLAAAQAMDCQVDQVVRDGELFVGPKEEPLSLDEVIEHAFRLGLQLSAQGYWQLPRIHWDFEAGSGIPYFTYSYGAQVAEVEVARATGKVKVTRVWAAHDGGVIVFPQGARGQLIGGVAQGLGFALTEGFDFVGGYPQKRNLKEYHIPTSLDMPEVECTFIETPFPAGPYGAKNLAEPVMLATAPAIANAVFHAVGVRCRRLPISADWLRAEMKRLPDSEET